MKPYRVIYLFLLVSIIPFTAHAQDNGSSEDSIRLFIDCQRCDESYIRQEIAFVNYVRDKEDSDLHLLITQQRTGSGGTEYTLRFLGREDFAGRDNRLKYISAESDTEDEERKGLVRIIKIGLVGYISQTPALDHLSISYDQPETAQSTAKEDKWNYWVFEVNGRSYFSGESSQSSLYLSFGGSADRVTKDWKINTRINYDYNRRTFSETDSLGNKTTEIYTTESENFDGNVVKSLTDHWSAGIFTEMRSSTRRNIDLSASISPGIEYNIFPYEEYAEHEINFVYMISAGYFDYEETTIFNKNTQMLVRQQVRADMEFTQTWGEIEGRVNASTYLHDLSKNRVETRLEFDFRIFRGLSLNLSGRYSLINDQLSIPKGDISDAEQLLNLRQQATSYSYGGSIGIEYSFGSIYNNVVNPRF